MKLLDRLVAFRAGWTVPQWRLVRTLLASWAVLYVLLIFTGINWYWQVQASEQLREEVFRLRFDLKYRADRQHFEQQWKHK